MKPFRAITLLCVTALSASCDKSSHDTKNGGGVSKDFLEAKAMAEKGDAVAQLNLGRNYYHGRGVAQDFEEAIKWYRKAAEQNHARAQFYLCQSYAFGEGVQKDYLEAAKWFRKAAEQNDSHAQYHLEHV